jgi:hypothetical protein
VLMLRALSRATFRGDRHPVEPPPPLDHHQVESTLIYDYDPGISWISKLKTKDSKRWQIVGGDWTGRRLTWKSGLVWMHFQYIVASEHATAVACRHLEWLLLYVA